MVSASGSERCKKVRDFLSRCPYFREATEYPRAFRACSKAGERLHFFNTLHNKYHMKAVTLRLQILPSRIRKCGGLL